MPSRSSRSSCMRHGLRLRAFSLKAQSPIGLLPMQDTFVFLDREVQQLSTFARPFFLLFSPSPPSPSFPNPPPFPRTSKLLHFLEEMQYSGAGVRRGFRRGSPRGKKKGISLKNGAQKLVRLSGVHLPQFDVGGKMKKLMMMLGSGICDQEEGASQDAEYLPTQRIVSANCVDMLCTCRGGGGGPPCSVSMCL